MKIIMSCSALCPILMFTFTIKSAMSELQGTLQRIQGCRGSSSGWIHSPQAGMIGKESNEEFGVVRDLRKAEVVTAHLTVRDAKWDM